MATLPRLKKVQTDLVSALSAEGEVYSAKKELSILIPGDEDFTLWFTHLTAIIKGVKQISDFKLLYWISANISHNEGVICLNKHYKEKIGKEMGVSQTSINRSIASLKCLEVIYPYPGANRSAFFYVNPCFLWKGDKINRRKQQEFILRLIKENQLPDREKEIQEDIARFQEYYESEKDSVRFDFSKISAA